MSTRGIILEDTEGEGMTVIVEVDREEVARWRTSAFVTVTGGRLESPTGKTYQCDWIGRGENTGGITCLTPIWEAEE